MRGSEDEGGEEGEGPPPPPPPMAFIFMAGVGRGGKFTFVHFEPRLMTVFRQRF